MDEIFGDALPPVRPIPAPLDIDSGELMVLMSQASQVGDPEHLGQSDSEE